MLMRTDPFRQLDRLTEQLLGTPARPVAMPFDAYRKGDTFLVQFDLPGINPESVELTVEKNVLTVHAERTRPSADDVELVVSERQYGSFSRQIFLGETLDTDAIQADYANGVLTVTIPVSEQAKPRRIKVGSSTDDRFAIPA